MTTNTTTTTTLTARQKQGLTAHIKSHIESRGLVRRRLEEVKSSQAQAFAYVFIQQLLFRGIESPSLRRELAELAEISRDDYRTASAALEKQEG